MDLRRGRFIERCLHAYLFSTWRTQMLLSVTKIKLTCMCSANSSGLRRPSFQTVLKRFCPRAEGKSFLARSSLETFFSWFSGLKVSLPFPFCPQDEPTCQFFFDLSSKPRGRKRAGRESGEQQRKRPNPKPREFSGNVGQIANTFPFVFSR